MPTPSDYYDPGTGNWRNFNPPPTTPGVFNPADPYGRRPDPSRTTESSTRDGNPQATQTAAAPPPTPAAAAPPALTPQQKAYYDAHIAGHPGEMSEAEYAQYLARQNAGNVAAANAVGRPQDAAGLTPVADQALTPADVKPPEPAAKPLPNLGAWTPDQAKPWMHVKPIAPQQVPDRPPDTHVGTRPAWNPRPGEAGYGQGPRQPGNYSFGEMLGFALQAGFTGPAAYTAAAIGLAESNGNPNSIHYNDGGKPFNSYGLMQINGSNDAAVGGARNALDPLTSFKQAYTLSKGGTDFSPWSTFKDGSYKAYLDGNARPEASSTLVVGPRQEYRPPPGREPGQWGAPVSHDWTPGNMPTAHDIPGILGALLPIAIAGVLGGGGLGMIAAYAGYQNARNKAQSEEAKQQRTRFRDQLAETEAGLKSELLESSNLMAEYGGDITSPAAKQAWTELAAKYQDPYLRAAVESGNSAAIQELFKKRDEAFQSISKVSAATTKADEQAAAAEKAKADEGAMGFPETPGTGGGTGVPAGPEKPWEHLGPGFAGGPPAAPPPPPGSGGPAAGTPPASAPAPQPAAAPAPSEQPAPPAEEPAPPPEPGESPPLPDVNVTAPQVPPAPPAPTATPAAAGAPRTPFEAMVSDIVNGEEIEKLKPAISADGLKKLQFAAADKETQIEAVKPGPHAAEQLKRIDPTFGYYAEGVSNYTMPDPTARSQNRGYIARLFAAAQKINPYWDYKDYATKQEFRTSFNPDKDVGKTLSRTSRLMNLTKELADDAAHLPNTNVASFNNLIAWFQGKEVGDPRYTKFIADWRLFANDAQAVASGKGIPPVTLTSHLIDTLQMGATPQMIRQGIKEDLLAALSSVDPSIAGWHVQFPGQANPGMFDQGIYGQLNQYAHMNIETGAVPEALPDVGTSQQWGGQTHYYLGGDITNKNNWSLVKPPGTQ